MKPLLFALLICPFVLFAQDAVPIKKMDKSLVTPELHYQKAGNLMISGGAMLMFSGILLTAGYAADVDILKYAGAGSSFVGISLFIGAGSHFKKGGKLKPTAF